ncbi:MAG: D-aminoacyl-tRNA deacylase [Bacteroides sp.]|nr:D-aminoacyl-tRNA deacylase [Eubacterium sp.]MCM1417381.1 D-aminoacyl-tRNA deacylase [Roseburia sp.]MCM1461427.1 D-aminoacyl-tRNA deacylase [Bacteroides sp.]
MRFLIQRVKEASCTVDGSVTGAIGTGYLVLIGIADRDDEAVAAKMVKKLVGLRIFEDEDGKTNRSLGDVGGGLLLISQFTLYADCKRGNRPSFTGAGKPDHAKRLYERIVAACRAEVPVVETGIFGADMKVALLNDGPFTVLLDSEEIF